MYAINRTLEDWRSLTIHESSPAERGASLRLRTECENYVSSHYWDDGREEEDGHLNIDLQNQKFEDESFDVVVTQDVFEHLPHPELAAREIFRTLKPGGYFIQTVPLVRGFESTIKWAHLKRNGKIKWNFKEEYHGNPIDNKGSPVFWHYGYDIASLIDKWANFSSVVIKNEAPKFGVEGQLIEVVISRKPVKKENPLKPRLRTINLLQRRSAARFKLPK